MNRNPARVLVGAFRGGSGKTLVSLGMLGAWRARGGNVAAFKKGPDYIDAAWLGLASGGVCHNLDTYLMGREAVRRSFARHASGADLAFVEGNRGLFDGLDDLGEHSSHALARLLGLPVVLVVDCTKATRTVAALVKGCQVLDEAGTLCGVILNRVGGARHEAVVRRSIERYSGLEVFGALPRTRDLDFRERHLGLYPPEEHRAAEHVLDAARSLLEAHADLDRLRAVLEQRRGSESAASVPPVVRGTPEGDEAGSAGIRVGVVRDDAFHFYYPENLEALRERGAEIVEIAAAASPDVGGVDALYIGGGFPESRASALSENRGFLASIRSAVEEGLPVYAECGGAILLGEGLEIDDAFFPFAGVFPVVYRMHARPQGHGYTLLEVTDDNPFFQPGTFLKGHEFHYAGVSRWDFDALHFACSVRRGFGFDGAHEGLQHHNAYASFSHLHALGDSRWAEGFLKRADEVKDGKAGCVSSACTPGGWRDSRKGCRAPAPWNAASGKGAVGTAPDHGG